MRHASLFSGIGGFDLAAEWMGWENVFHCEIAEFPRKILNYYWPNAITYENIITTDFTIHRGRIDVLTGGFPCQPYSLAGKRRGKDDDRHLWPEMLRTIREIQPRWVVGENVFGLVNWNGGLVFDEVQADLETEGYKVQPFVLPACAVNAPHRRDRVWFVAYSGHNTTWETRNSSTDEREEIATIHQTKQGRNWEAVFDTGLCDLSRNSPNPDIIGCKGGVHEERLKKTKCNISSRDARSFRISNWYNFPTQSPVRSRDDGLSTELDGITFSKWRNESIKGYGNAIVPQVAYQIFQAIQDYTNAELTTIPDTRS